MIIIHYVPKQYTNSDNEYVTIDENDMGILIRQCVLLLAKYAELTALSAGAKLLLTKNKEQYGYRGQKAYIAPSTANNRLSLLGGVIDNYYKKASAFKNDLSKSQLPYLENIFNEAAEQFDDETIKFKVDFFNFED